MIDLSKIEKKPVKLLTESEISLLTEKEKHDYFLDCSPFDDDMSWAIRHKIVPDPLVSLDEIREACSNINWITKGRLNEEDHPFPGTDPTYWLKNLFKVAGIGAILAAFFAALAKLLQWLGKKIAGAIAFEKLKKLFRDMLFLTEWGTYKKAHWFSLHKDRVASYKNVEEDSERSCVIQTEIMKKLLGITD